MNKILFLTLLMLSSSAFSAISEVSSGNAIEAAKLNEIIQKLNSVEEELALAKQKVVPAGSVISMAGNCPVGYLDADGRSLVRSENTILFNAIGTAHGAPSGSTFNIPDYRGRFLRGVDGTANLDPDKASRTAMNPNGNSANNIGSVQGHAFQTHSHLGQANATGSTGQSGGGPEKLYVAFSTGTSSAGAQGANSQASTLETRPVNAYVKFCIKAE